MGYETKELPIAHFVIDILTFLSFQSPVLDLGADFERPVAASYVCTRSPHVLYREESRAG